MNLRSNANRVIKDVSPFLRASSIFLVASLAFTFMAKLDRKAWADQVSYTPFTLTDVRDGTTYSSTEFRSAAFMVEFYFNSCPACNQNAQAVNDLAYEFHSPRTQVIQYGIDCDASDYTDWLQKHPAQGPVLNGCDRELPNELGVRAYPTTVIFSCTGQELYRHVGVWSSGQAAEIRAVLTNEQFRVCE